MNWIKTFVAYFYVIFRSCPGLINEYEEDFMQDSRITVAVQPNSYLNTFVFCCHNLLLPYLLRVGLVL
jgi:hypothetical protein